MFKYQKSHIYTMFLNRDMAAHVVGTSPRKSGNASDAQERTLLKSLTRKAVPLATALSVSCAWQHIATARMNSPMPFQNIIAQTFETKYYLQLVQEYSGFKSKRISTSFTLETSDASNTIMALSCGTDNSWIQAGFYIKKNGPIYGFYEEWKKGKPATLTNGLPEILPFPSIPKLGDKVNVSLSLVPGAIEIDIKDRSNSTYIKRNFGIDDKKFIGTQGSYFCGPSVELIDANNGHVSMPRITFHNESPLLPKQVKTRSSYFMERFKSVMRLVYTGYVTNKIPIGSVVLSTPANINTASDLANFTIQSK